MPRRASEALEDICTDFEEVFQRPLLNAYQAATKPCIVAFTRPGGWHGAVRAALSYVYYSLRGLDHARWCNANFSGEGKAIPADWIDEIDWLTDRP